MGAGRVATLTALGREKNEDRSVALPYSAAQNQLLAGLAPADYARLEPLLELAPMRAGWSLSEAGERLRHVYFPTTAIVSLVHILRSGASTEVALVGSEGVIGMASLLGGGSAPERALVRISGHAYRVGSEMLSAEFGRSSALREVLLHFTQALMTQIAQTAVCNRHHSIEQQLCRWLLLCLDRIAVPHLAITHETIAHMLGVRREGVTSAARKLQDAGLIKCGRGRIVVLDRAGLEAHACECYALVRAEYRRLSGRALANPAATTRATSVAPPQRPNGG